MLKHLLSARHFNCAVSLPAWLTISYLQGKNVGSITIFTLEIWKLRFEKHCDMLKDMKVIQYKGRIRSQICVIWKHISCLILKCFTIKGNSESKLFIFQAVIMLYSKNWWLLWQALKNISLAWEISYEFGVWLWNLTRLLQY